MALAVIMTVWCAGPVAKLGAAYLLWKRGMMMRYPSLWAFLVFSAVCSTALIAVHGSKARYTVLFNFTSPMTELFEACAIVGVFRVLTENYPRFRIPGTILLSGLAVLGVAIAWVSSFMGAPAAMIDSSRQILPLLQQSSIIMAVVLVGIRGLLAVTSEIPVRRSARRASDILTIHAGTGLACTVFAAHFGHRYPVVGSLIVVGSSLLFGVLCAACLTIGSDERREFTPLSRAELERHLEESAFRIRLRISQFRHAIRNLD